MEKKVLGIDISMDKLDISLYDGEKYIFNKILLNNNKSFKTILNFYRKHKISLVVMEATGVYHFKLAGFLYLKGLNVAVVNPLTIKRYGEMKLIRTKTDKLDAQLIASYGYEQNPPKFVLKEKYEEEIRCLAITREALIKSRTKHNNLIHALKNNVFKQDKCIKALNKTKNTINKEIQNIENEINRIIKEKYPKISSIIESIPGIGFVGKIIIIGFLNSYRNFDDFKKVIAFSGLNPAIKQSGKQKSNIARISKKGNSYIRKNLYMMALSAKRYNKSCSDLYKRLVEKGKFKKQALIAVANKLIKQSFAIIKNNSEYCQNYLNNYEKKLVF